MTPLALMPRWPSGLDHAGVLHREEALGDHDVQEHREHQRPLRHQQRDGLEFEHPRERAAVEADLSSVRDWTVKFC